MSSISYILLELFFIYIQNMHVKLLQSCQLLATLWTVARQPPRHMGFSRQGSWSGLLCRPPRDLPDPGTHGSYISCIDRRVLYHWKPKACVYVYTHTHIFIYIYIFPIFKCICSLPSMHTAFYTNDTKWYITPPCTKTPPCFFPNITTFDTLSHE